MRLLIILWRFPYTTGPVFDMTSPYVSTTKLAIFPASIEKIYNSIIFIYDKVFTIS